MLTDMLESACITIGFGYGSVVYSVSICVHIYLSLGAVVVGGYLCLHDTTLRGIGGWGFTPSPLLSLSLSPCKLIFEGSSG